VAGVLADLETSRLPEKEKALFRYLRKVNLAPAAIERADVDVLRAAGWSDEAIYDAVTVCSLFNFYNRWCDAMGVRDMPAEAFEMSGERIAAQGYGPPEPPAR
jgi:alkylhydroperoxidase family enzyme